MNEYRRLRRSYSDRKLAGVCGGIGEYFNIDPVIVRVAWIVFALMGGSGLVAYLICVFVVPSE